MLTISQAAGRLSLSVEEVRRLCRGRPPKLAHYRIGSRGGAIRIEEKDILRYLESTRVEGPEVVRLRFLKG